MSVDANSSPAWSLIWLRHDPGLAALRRQLRQQGGQLLVMPPWRILPRRDAPSAHALARALACPVVVFTSPAAVHAANALVPLSDGAPGTRFIAVGAGTARALQQAGIATVLSPQRMDSEGLLGLPLLQAVQDMPIGLVTAPGGRGVIPATLQQRGARVVTADVYDRRIRHLPARQRARLLRLVLPAWLALGSGKALETLWHQLSTRQRRALQQCRAVPASARLAETAARFGLPAAPRASSAMATALLAAVQADRQDLAACGHNSGAGCLTPPLDDGEPAL